MRRARESLVADLQSLAHDAERLIEATAEDVSDKTSEARERLSAAVDHIKETCGDWQKRGLESARAAAKQTDRSLRAHPYQAIGIGFGAGVLVGWLLRRK